MRRAENPAPTKIRGLISIRKAKPVNHWRSTHHAIEAAGMNAIKTRTINSFDNTKEREATEAPITFRIPISFVRCSAVKAANANRLKLAMKMARPENTPNIWPMRCSDLKQARRNANGHPENIDASKKLMLANVTKVNSKIISKHDALFF